MNRKKVLAITKIGIFAGLSTVLYFIRFPLPMFPSFLEIQFSVLPAIIGGFTMGPVGGILIVVIKFLMSLPFSKTAYVGDFADLLIGAATVLVTSMVYQKYKSKKGGLVALLLGSLTWIVTGVLANYFILVPAYLKLFFNNDLEGFLQLCRVVIKDINADNYMIKYILYAVIPFNALIAFVVSTITFLVYKKISNFLHKLDEEKQE
ncbi:MAG TPA: ECF transporter S component [Bacilli bacterium]|jgi:riboflavin transporter FmnP|nr:ECF transporter S component [Acholeplasmataceae bacterium]HNZ77738.1 ECF transporter S component [Bacilli bacterium]HOH61118.1 ECF transporter S component [Bacilli bacterium]HOR17479.1 ECF transporter S component [Bacilli bacterium]HPB49531.1 ECF transporter S component [Bacilli bacterium]